MPLFLANRHSNLTEHMEKADCSRPVLNNTYRQFRTVNSIISGWKQIYRSKMVPLAKDLKKTLSILDIGFGGGDIPLKLAKWARRDHLSLHITAIETDSRALQFVETIHKPQNVSFEHASSTQLLADGRRFDIVISNHLLHHLTKSNLLQLLSETEQLSKNLVLFNDIERSDLGYALFNIVSRPFFRNSFITADGLTSIKRSYTCQELMDQTPDTWKVERLFPFRLLLSYKH